LPILNFELELTHLVCTAIDRHSSSSQYLQRSYQQEP